jgi:uncharacterized protein YcbK (DUF882 family)
MNSKTAWISIRFFSPREFDSPDQPGSGQHMNLDFVTKLDRLRDAVGVPLLITSGFRTPEHNKKVGGVDSSAHELGRAADIAAFSGSHRYAIISAAMKLGFRRIGVGSTFVHIDDDITKPQDVFWTYPAKKG